MNKLQSSFNPQNWALKEKIKLLAGLSGGVKLDERTWRKPAGSV